MAYGGLRGAIAFSLAIMLDNHITQAQVFITATLFVILFTVFVMVSCQLTCESKLIHLFSITKKGSTIKPFIRLLQVKTQIRHEAKLFIEINGKLMETLMAGVEEVAGRRASNYWAVSFINKLDQSFIMIIRYLFIHYLLNAIMPVFTAKIITIQ